jgi:hypothetical protein
VRSRTSAWRFSRRATLDLVLGAVRIRGQGGRCMERGSGSCDARRQSVDDAQTAREVERVGLDLNAVLALVWLGYRPTYRQDATQANRTIPIIQLSTRGPAPSGKAMNAGSEGTRGLRVWLSRAVVRGRIELPTPRFSVVAGGDERLRLFSVSALASAIPIGGLRPSPAGVLPTRCPRLRSCFSRKAATSPQGRSTTPPRPERHF